MGSINNISLTEESAFIGTIAILARLIEYELVGRIYVPTRLYEKHVGFDAIFNDGQNFFLIQLKVKKSDENNLIKYHKFKSQIDKIFEVANDQLKGKDVVVLGGLGGICTDSQRTKLYIEKFEKIAEETKTYKATSWYADGKKLTGNNKEYDDIIVNDADKIGGVPHNIISKIWEVWGGSDLSILISEKKIIIAKSPLQLKKALTKKKETSIFSVLRFFIKGYPVLNGLTTIIILILLVYLIKPELMYVVSIIVGIISSIF